MNGYIEELLEKEKYKEKKTKELLSDYSYIEWLVNYTNEKKSFFSDDNEKDENVKNLEYFFNGIDKYASDNYIYSIPNEFGEYYNIKYNNIGLEIGYIAGQGIYFYCNKVQIDNEDKFIDFDYIITNKKQPNTVYIEQSLNKINNIIIELYNSGMPLDDIGCEVKKIIKDINNKVLKKK